jgi:cytochrome c oxidase subunit 2
MPTYQGQISEEGLIDLVEYIKTLKTGDRIQQTLHTTTFSPDQKGATDSAPDYRSEQLIGQPHNGEASPDTSTSKGEGVSPQ